jgi:hypothetical protein
VQFGILGRERKVKKIPDPGELNAKAMRDLTWYDCWPAGRHLCEIMGKRKLPGNWGRLMFSFPLKEERRQSQGIIDH